MDNNNNHEIASKYIVELNSKYSTFNKQGSSSGKNIKENILKAIQEQSKSQKEGE